MFLKITQRTKCRYSRPVDHARIEYRVFPASNVDQRVLGLEVDVTSPGAPVDIASPSAVFIDAWGNLCRKVEWSRPIDSWSFAVDLFVETLRQNPFDFPLSAVHMPIPADTHAWPAEVHGYIRWEYDPWDNDPEVKAWAIEQSASESGAFKKIQSLMQTTSQEFNFCKGLTDVKTPPGEILKLKMGVCQDFATLLIASSRALGLPARYVSGYIYEGPRAKRQGPAPAGHGWAEVFFPEIGWRGFDPLNGILTCHTHVRTAQGRWYADAAPVIGRFIGIGVEQTSQTEIHVDMADASGRIIEV